MAKYLDETGLAHFWENIKKQLVVRTTPASDVKQAYIARLSAMDAPSYRYGQGSCLLSDSNMVCSMTTSDGTGCKLYNIDLDTKTIIDTYDVPSLGHCNDLYYDGTTIYAALNGTTVYKLSPTTFDITGTYTFSNTIRSIFGHDNEIYAVASIRTGVVTICSVNFSNSTTTELLDLVLPKTDNAAIQTARYYDGYYYVLMGGNEQQYLYKYDEDGNYVGTVHFSNQVAYFYVTEYESFNFTTHGDIVMYSQASIAGCSGYACVISALDFSGHITMPVRRTNAAPKRNARVKYTSSYNERLAPTGDSGNQFMSIEEAVAFGYINGMNALYLESDANWLGSGASGFLNIIEWSVYINANSKTIYFGDANSVGPELTGLTLEITNGTIMNGTNGGYLRLYNATCRLVGVTIDGSNCTTVAPVRFNACSVFINTTCSKNNLTQTILVNDCLIVHPSALSLTLSGQLYAVSV